MTEARPLHWTAVAYAALAAAAVAAIGAALTDIGPWYLSLREPSWKPPDAAFGPIWTTIFVLATAAGILAWRHEASARGQYWIIGLFAVNALLNILWTLLFFHLHRPDLALLEVGALWLSIFVLIGFLGRRSRLAGGLLVPYLAWVSLASALNWQVVLLNGPFR